MSYIIYAYSFEIKALEINTENSNEKSKWQRELQTIKIKTSNLNEEAKGWGRDKKEMVKIVERVFK